MFWGDEILDGFDVCALFYETVEGTIEPSSHSITFRMI